MNRTFTLRELLAVVTMIAIFLAIVAPFIRVSREAARQSHCSGNLCQIALALQNYHDTFLRLPYGRGPAELMESQGVSANRGSWQSARLPSPVTNTIGSITSKG